MRVAPNIRPLSAALQTVAKEELNEVESRIAEDLETFRRWIKSQPHLNVRTCDQFLVAILRRCKYSMEKSKSKLDYAYTIKTMTPEALLNNRMDDHFIELCRAGISVALPQPMGEGGPRIQLVNYSKLDPKVFTLNDHIRLQIMITTWQLYHDDNFIISGMIVILDLSNINLSLLAQFDPTLIKKLLAFLDKGAAVRIKGIHVVNCPIEFRTALTIARGFLSHKLQQRLFIHKTIDELHKVIPKENLPVEYGGSNGTVAQAVDQMAKDLVAFNDFFIEEDLYVVNEKLRPGRAMDHASLFGIEGSFRKLDID